MYARSSEQANVAMRNVNDRLVRGNDIPMVPAFDLGSVFEGGVKRTHRMGRLRTGEVMFRWARMSSANKGM